MVFMDTGGGFHDGNVSHWWDQKQPSFTSQTCSENINWETAAVHMSVAGEATIKANDRFNAPMEFYGCPNYPRYHADRFHTYRN